MFSVLFTRQKHLSIIVLCLSCTFLGLLLFTGDIRSFVFGDSATYIQGQPIRGAIYPWFLKLALPAELHAKFAWDGITDPNHYKDFFVLCWIQRGLTFAVGVLFFKLISRIHFLSPLVICGALIAYQTLYPQAHLLGEFRDQVNSMMTEGIMYTWLFILLSILIVTANRTDMFSAFILGTIAYAGIEIAPRLLPFAVVILSPTLISIFCDPVNTESSRFRQFRNSLLSVLTFSALFLAKSALTLQMYGVFSPIPFNGFSAIAPAIFFAGPDDYKDFSVPLEREFVKTAVGENPGPPRTLLVNNNAAFICNKMPNLFVSIFGPGGPDITLEQNAFFAKVSALLLKKPNNVARWMEWTFKMLQEMYDARLGLNLWFLVMPLLIVIGFLARKLRHSILVVALLLFLVHLGNAFLTIALQGYLPRYITISEFGAVLGFGLTVCVFFRYIHDYVYSLNDFEVRR